MFYTTTIDGLRYFDHLYYMINPRCSSSTRRWSGTGLVFSVEIYKFIYVL
jgi:hypothetical protein